MKASNFTLVLAMLLLSACQKDTSVTRPVHFTETEYADNYTDSINRNNYALPTKTISYAEANGTGTVFVTSVQYDFNTSLPRYGKDANDQISEIQYDDALLRPTKTIAPNGQQTITVC